MLATANRKNLAVRQNRESEENAPGPLGLWLDRGILATLFLFVIAAPNSIAATQTAWLIGLLFWALRLFVWPRPGLHRTPLDYALLGFPGLPARRLSPRFVRRFG